MMKNYAEMNLNERMDYVIRDFQNVPEEIDFMGIDKILRKWTSNKWWLRKKFVSHPNYNGNYQIVFKDADMSRRVCSEIAFSHLCNIVNERRFSFRINDDFELEQEMRRFENGLMSCIDNATSPFISESDAKYLNEHEVLNIKAHKGAKWTKLVARWARTTGVDKWTSQYKHDGYSYEYQEFCKYMSPFEKYGTAILSINPIDYLLMSNGTDWASCHAIGKVSGKRGSYNMCCQSGTLSYLMDKNTVILYYLEGDYDGNFPEFEEKAHRVVIYLDYNGLFVQSRMYPDGRDIGNTGMGGNANRLLVDEFSKMFDVEYQDEHSKGNGFASRICDEADGATHYPDYSEYDDAVVVVPKNDNIYLHRTMLIGHAPICPICGAKHGRSGSLYCSSCINFY